MICSGNFNLETQQWPKRTPRADHKPPLNWLDDHLCLQSSGCEASSRLACLGLQWAVAPRIDADNVQEKVNKIVIELYLP